MELYSITLVKLVLYKSNIRQGEKSWGKGKWEGQGRG